MTVDVELVGAVDYASVDGPPGEFEGDLGLAACRAGEKIDLGAVGGERAPDGEGGDPGAVGGARVDAQGSGKGENGAGELNGEIPGFIARVGGPGSFPGAVEPGGVPRDGELLHIG